MAAEGPSIFRPDALRHFIEGRQRSVLPRLIRPRMFVCLWILLVLLGLAGFLAWTTRVPVYVSGVAVVAESDGKVRLLVIVPAELLESRPSPGGASEKLQVGQVVRIRRSTGRPPQSARISHVEPGVQSPAAVRRRFELSSTTVDRPVVVATVDAAGVLFDEPDESSSTTRLGTTATVDVEIGSRRALSLLPLLGDGL